MFTSQPQIGQDMANERQQQAARIRQATSASAATRPQRTRSNRRGWIRGSILRRHLVLLRSRFAAGTKSVCDNERCPETTGTDAAQDRHS